MPYFLRWSSQRSLACVFILQRKILFCIRCVKLQRAGWNSCILNAFLVFRRLRELALVDQVRCSAAMANRASSVAELLHGEAQLVLEVLRLLHFVQRR